MSRIRTIKPEFFTSSDIVEMTPLARLFYVSLWCEADREGRLNWNLKTLKMRYLPADDCSIEDLANELIAANLVSIYNISGREYAQIHSFTHHQVINNREADSIIPAFVDGSFTRESGVQGEGKEGRKGKEGKGREGATQSLDFTCWPNPPSKEILSDWKKVRQAKKSPLTQTAISRMAKEIRLSVDKGYTVDDCIGAAVEKGWTGFKAEWLDNYQKPQGVEAEWTYEHARKVGAGMSLHPTGTESDRDYIKRIKGAAQ